MKNFSYALIALVVVGSAIQAQAGPGDDWVHIPERQSLGNFPSSDGAYVASVRHSDGDAHTVTVYRAQGGKPVGPPLFPPAADATNIEWLPGRGHTLVFGTSSLYGKPGLTSWSGTLHHLRGPENYQQDQCYLILGPGKKNNHIYFTHRIGDLSGAQGDKVEEVPVP